MRRLEKFYIDIPAAAPGTVGSFALAAAAAGIATVLRLALEPWVVGVQFITFVPAVIIIALISGFRAGLFCVLLCAVAAWWMIFPSWGGPHTDWEQAFALGLFAAVSSVNVALVAVMRFAIKNYRELSQSLEQQVSERTQQLLSTQASLAQSQKMEAIGQLTGGLAHDFNNMIAVVMGNLDIMRRRLRAGDTDVLRYIDNAMEGAERAATLTQRLLAFARNQPLEPAAVDVNALTQNMSELLHRTLGETIRLECVLGAGLWRAHIDPSQLESAIVNLAANARDAMPGGGKLTIETANVHLDEQYAATRADVSPGQYVVVAVSDTGIGMSPDVRARAFDPFFTTKPPGKGTGLSQVFGFVKQSKGHLAIYSEEGRGTTIRLYLPRSYSTEETEQGLDRPAELAPIGGRDGEAVLVVEDDDHVRRMSVAMLQELGYRVREASSAAKALELLDSDAKISLLFTDVVMPVMDGRQLADEALQRRPDLKVLYTTGYTRNAIIHNGTLDPGLALIAKPFSAEQLAERVRGLLDQESSK